MRTDCARKLVKLQAAHVRRERDADVAASASHALDSPGRILVPLERQLLELVADPNGRLDRPERVRIEAQGEAGEGRAYGTHRLHLLVWGKYASFDLDGREPVPLDKTGRILHDFAGLATKCLPGRDVDARLHVGDHRDSGAKFATEQPVQRLTECLPDDVPASRLQRLYGVFAACPVPRRQRPQGRQNGLTIER